MAYTLSEIEQFAADPHAPDVWRQLLETMRENERLKKALWHISVNSMPPDDWCEVPKPIARYAKKAIE